MKISSKEFRSLIDRMLKAHGLKFKGIHVRCTKCGDEAFAATLETAAGFGGWSELRKARGANYHGLCADCCKSKPRSKRRSHD